MSSKKMTQTLHLNARGQPLLVALRALPTELKYRVQVPNNHGRRLPRQSPIRGMANKRALHYSQMWRLVGGLLLELQSQPSTQARQRPELLGNLAETLAAVYCTTFGQSRDLAGRVKDLRDWYPVLPATNGALYKPLPEEPMNKRRTSGKLYSWFNVDHVVTIYKGTWFKQLDNVYSRESVEQLKKAVDERTGKLLSTAELFIISNL
ncbi:hypothetical protein CVT24_011715 [Panaeolus cyanescens]|uniref:Uncharacterized protein n=1 Tax=Panaeolus cyanescens TaxID=181874 RepID=A0A409YHC6_9AGAR|nr:hypothetical protein CVT24_011715 [Panaeolus cyanescens]